MALQFNTIGFINFNKDYNKVLKSGAITVSFTTSVKNNEGEYVKQYFNGLIPAKLAEYVKNNEGEYVKQYFHGLIPAKLAQKAKPFLNKELVKISGIASPAQKGYINFTILEVEQYQKQKKSDDTENDLPF